MGIGFFTEKNCEPTEAEIQQAVGARLPLWDALSRFIQENYPVQEDLKFLYGKTYGWARRFRIRGQLLASLYPTDGGFTAQVNLSPAGIEKALAMAPGRNVRAAIERAHPYPEGRWLFVPVASEVDARDVRNLIALRIEDKRLLG
jgi:hypothetical protein